MTSAVTIQKWGNSQGIRLPKYILESLDWSVNDELLVRTDEKNLIIEKKSFQKHTNIKELFADFNEDYQPVSVDWGEPKGNEIW